MVALPLGLVNNGNTCYLNALLQILWVIECVSSMIV